METLFLAVVLMLQSGGVCTPVHIHQRMPRVVPPMRQRLVTPETLERRARRKLEASFITNIRITQDGLVGDATAFVCFSK